jgi:hypothetical protein
MSKRKDGRGALYHRADGRWEAQYRLAGGGRKSVYGRSRREDRGRLAVRRTLQAQRGMGLVFGAPKTRTSNRTVVLTMRALRELRDHRIRETKRRDTTARWQNTGLVFTNDG